MIFATPTCMYSMMYDVPISSYPPLGIRYITLLQFILDGLHIKYTFHIPKLATEHIHIVHWDLTAIYFAPVSISISISTLTTIIQMGSVCP
jgi:hypothetical protein